MPSACEKSAFVRRDGTSGATPKGSFDVRLERESLPERFVVMVEVNHSTDFNDHYPKTAKEGDTDYSGGEYGSGQPALVYRADIDLTADRKEFEARLIGHSSADGSTGEIYNDMAGITTARDIVKRIAVSAQ